MNLKMKDVITLGDNRDYIVTSIATIDGYEYLYLVEIYNYSNIKFCKVFHKNNTYGLQEINDNNTLIKIMPILSSTIIEAFA